MKTNASNSVSFFFWRKYFVLFFLCVISFLFLGLVLDGIGISYVLFRNSKEIIIENFIEYYYEILPDILITSIAISIPLSFYFYALQVKKRYYWLYLELCGYAWKKLWRNIGFTICLAFPVLVYINESLSKSLRSHAELVLLDKILRVRALDSNFYVKGQSNLDISTSSNGVLFFALLRLDSPESDSPELSNLVYWPKNDDKTRVIFAERGTVKKNIEMKRCWYYSAVDIKIKVKEVKNCSIFWKAFSNETQRIKVVSFASMTLTEGWQNFWRLATLGNLNLNIAFVFIAQFLIFFGSPMMLLLMVYRKRFILH